MRVVRAAVVGDDHAVEAQLIAQKTGQQIFRGMHGQPVQGAVAGHHAAQITLPYRRLKGLGKLLAQHTVVDLGVCAVDAALGIVKAKEVLGHALGLAAVLFVFLNALRVGCAKLSGQGAVFAVRLAGAAHARVARDVQHRGEDLCDAAGKLLTADDLTDLFLRLRVEGSAAGDAGGEAHAARHQRAAETLHMKDGGDVQLPLPCGRLGIALLVAKFQRADLSDAVFQKSSHAIFRTGVGKHARKLCELLFHGQFLCQLLRPFTGREGSVHPAFCVFHRVVLLNI